MEGATMAALDISPIPDGAKHSHPEGLFSLDLASNRTGADTDPAALDHIGAARAESAAPRASFRDALSQQVQQHPSPGHRHARRAGDDTAVSDRSFPSSRTE